MTAPATITSLGHAGLDVRLGDVRLVCDPWLTPRGAYLGTWHQFPDNGAIAAAALHDAPFLFISSPRPDHLDVETLMTFPRTIRVLLPALPSPTLAAQVRALGFGDVVELPADEPHELAPGVRLTVLPSAYEHLSSSTLVLEGLGELLVIQHDCLLDGETHARLAARKPTVHFLSFSGSSSGAAYAPAIYELADDERRRQATEEATGLAARFFATAREVGARHVVASGGPPCFLDARGFELNFDGGIFLDADELLARAAREAPDLVERLRALYPGDVARGRQGEWEIAGRRPYEDKRAYLEAYRERRAPERERQLAELRAAAEPVDGKVLRAHLRELFQFEDMTWDIGMLIHLHLADGPDAWIDFRKKPYRYLGECDEPASCVLTVEAAWVSLVLQEKVMWHELLLGHHVTIRHEPGAGMAGLMKHLEYRHDPDVFEAVRRLNPAVITVQDEKMEYVCQRFCPHRGRDLEYAIIERGVLTCTAHGWRFDLRKEGRCLWGGDTPLVVKEIRPLKA